MSPAPSFKEKEDSSRKLSVPDDAPPRDYRFWLVFVGIGLSFILTALELSAVATALPRIASDLHASTFVWVGSAYALAATAFIPLAGGLAQIFGRRAVVLSSLAIMIAGSAMAGAAPNMNFLIAARTVQGLGGGGVSAATAIILSDLVPLHERGVFNGIIGIFWSVASVVGPIVGGALAQGGQWRWLFYLNIPFACAAMLLFFVFLRVPSPAGTIVEKAARVDWLGSLFIIAATASCCVALAWSGVEHAWVSTPVLVPLILGLVGLVACVVYETLLPKYPVVPFSLMSQRTGASGYLQTFISSLVLLGVTYYVPVYFQACKELSPIGSGVGLLAFAAFLGIGGILSGVSVKKTGHYRPQLWIAWALIVIGLGAYTTLNADSPRINAIALLIVSGTGMGMLVTTTYFPVLAPIPVSFNAPALAYFMFLRNFAQVWGITIGGAVLQNQLSKRIPQAFLSQFSQGTAIAYASIPLIPDLSEPLKTEVRTAFADSLRIVWLVNLAFAGIGLLASTLMKHLPLHTTIDKDWALEGAPQDLPSPDLERSGQKE